MDVASVILPADLRFSLRLGEVHVFCAHLAAIAEALADREVPLAPDERARANRFRCAEHRRLFGSRRRLLRLLLASYLHMPAASVIVETNAYGKPCLARDRELQFSLSRSGDHVVYAFARARQIGIDLERIRSGIDPEQIARRFFSPPEQQFLRARPEPLRLPTFYRIWTRKEAYVKALGCGLSIPLDSFAVSVSDGDGPALMWSAAEHDTDYQWSLFPAEPFPNCVAALVVDRPRGRPVVMNLDPGSIGWLGADF